MLQWGEQRNKEVFPAVLLKVLLTLCQEQSSETENMYIMNAQSNFLSVEFSNNNNDKKNKKQKKKP